MPRDKDGKPIYLKFINFYKKMKVPFVVYGDFECCGESIDTCSPDKSKSFTNKYANHKPTGFCYIIKFFDENYEPVIRRYTAKSPDEDVGKIFMVELEKDIREICEKIKPNKKMNWMTQREKYEHEKAKICHICEEELLEKDKVKDHCHYTGKYRGAAHSDCNLNYKNKKFIPIIFHNLSGYDSHLFIKNIGLTKGKVDCIPNNEEKYISFTKQIVLGKYINKKGEEKEDKLDIRFIDSFKFMSTSIDKLVANLTKCGKCEACKPGDCTKRYIKDGKIIQYKGIGRCEKCKNCLLVESRCLSPSDDRLEETKKVFGDKMYLMLRKGVFPYDYFDSLDKLNETQLPPIEEFYSKLNGKQISKDDYEYAKKVWKTFNMKTMREYHDLYLLSDALFLMDVFENFRDTCMKNYGLDPAHYYTLPGFAWDAALKYTKVKLELLTDNNMLLMFEKGVRGGVSQISKRFAKANNPYLEEYDPNQPTIYITYQDANNLYGGGMSEPLPTHGFEWMREEEYENWRDIPCVVEVDLEYPENLHDLHNDYPLAPDKLTVNKVEKLIPNLNNKEKYVVHRETLKEYESLGLKITKIHRGIKFEESKWLKPYIDFNTELRAEAKNDFEKDFFKLMNNAVFGKTMENIRKRVDIRLVTNKKEARKLIKQPNYQHRTIFSKNLAAIHMKRKRIKFNKPVYLGMCILDLSKKVMYDFHYNYIKRKYGDKVKLLMTDTDSLVYEIETLDFYKDISPDVREKFDTSNYPRDHPSRIELVNKKVIGKFKDEMGGIPIKEFTGLRSKLYSILTDKNKEINKDKGIKQSVVKNTITHNDYNVCLKTRKPQMREMNIIRSRLHNVYSETVNKIALSANDDKRIICEDGIHTLAIGHYRAEPSPAELDHTKTESGGSSVS